MDKCNDDSNPDVPSRSVRSLDVVAIAAGGSVGGSQASISQEGLSIIELVLAKHEDYGGSVFSSPSLCPDVSASDAILVRMSDKFARIVNLSRNSRDPDIAGRDVVGESLNDTMRDVCGYAILWLCCRQNETERRKGTSDPLVSNFASENDKLE